MARSRPELLSSVGSMEFMLGPSGGEFDEFTGLRHLQRNYLCRAVRRLILIAFNLSRRLKACRDRGAAGLTVNLL